MASRSIPWQGTAYAQHSGHHRSADDWFLRRHPPAESDVVVDLGCGSGEFTATVAALVPHGRVTGVDPDASMLDAARRHEGDNLTFVRARAEEVDSVVDPGSTDLVLSRAMLHWLPRREHPRLFRAIRTILRPGGVAHLEGAGPGNIPRITSLLEDLATRHDLRPPAPFPDPGREFEVVESAGLEVAEAGVGTVAQRRTFTRDDLIGVLRSQATLVLTRQVAEDDTDRIRAIVDEAVDRVDELRRDDGSYDQTFVRLEVLARRPL